MIIIISSSCCRARSQLHSQAHRSFGGACDARQHSWRRTLNLCRRVVYPFPLETTPHVLHADDNGRVTFNANAASGQKAAPHTL